jgi:pyruvate dehydrogenase E1 component
VLGDVVAHARAQGLSVATRTPYRNTIPADRVPPYPGDEPVERRINARLRWNAMAMVVRANKRHAGLGGHLSTYASTLTLWEVGFQHFFRGRGPEGGPVVPGDQVYFQGHASPGIYARAFLEGRLDAQQLDLFRQEVAGAGRGLPSYPHPRSMAGFWEFPTVSLGIGPLHAIHQARFNRHLAARGIADTEDARVWCFVGDGETDEPETLAAIRLAAREHLDNLTFVVNGNLQRLDGPVRGNSRILDELEGVFAGAGRGLPSYPHPRSMPGFWEFPTVSLGIGPLHAVHQARFNRYLAARGIADTENARVWCFVGDGETDEPETLAEIRLAAREHLDNLIFVVNGNLQRLDGPVRGNSRILDELEGVFAGAGWHALKVLWGSEWEPLFAAPAGRILSDRLEAMNDGELQRLTVLDATELRKTLFGGDPALGPLGDTLKDEQLLRLRRGGHDPQTVYAAYADAVAHRGSPTVVLAQTVKGYALGPNFEGRNATHQMKKMSPEQLRIFRDILELPVSDAELADGLPPYLPLAEGSAELDYLRDHRQRLGGVLPRRPASPVRLTAEPAEAVFTQFDAGSGTRAVSTTVAYTRLLRSLMRDTNLGARIVPIVPDEGRTFGFEVLYSQFGIYAPDGQHYTPVDGDLPLSYTESATGQVLQEGITEAGGMAELAAAATTGATWGTAVIPFFTYYSMFGFQRVGDLIWALADARGRGFLVGATAGRTTLSGEGLQHTDGFSHLAALAVPACRAYDPAFAYETAAVVRDGIRRMFVDGEECFYYLTVYNEDYLQPAKPEDSGIPGVSIDDAIIDGLYRLTATPDGGPVQIRLLASGPAVRCAQQAAARLASDHGIASEVWSVTSWKQLREDALDAERSNRAYPDQPPRVSHLRRALGDQPVPVVAVTDYVSALPDQLARYLGAPMTTLGTDGYGLSDSREELRAYFHTDSGGISNAVLSILDRKGRTDLLQAAPELDRPPMPLSSLEEGAATRVDREGVPSRS